MAEMFPERELRGYAVPTPISKLVVGEMYYIVNFLDEEMLIPELQAVVYIGKRNDPGKKNRLTFQDAASYGAGTNPEIASDENPVTLHSFSTRRQSSIYSFDEALNVLLRCALRRERLKRAPTSST